MATGDWCKTTEVEQRLSYIRGKNWTDTNVEERMNRSKNCIKTKLASAYSVDTMNGWDTAGATPGTIKELCADFTALFIKQDFFKDFIAGPGERAKTWDLLQALVDGTAEIIDVDGSIVARSSNRVQTNNSTGKTPMFSIGNVGDGSYGEGTLDDYGPDEEGAENV